MRSKSGEISLVVVAFVIIVTGALLLIFFDKPINEAYASFSEPIKKNLEEETSDETTVEEENRESANAIFDNFKNIIEKCENSQDLKCACGAMDFTDLNDFSIVLTRVVGETKPKLALSGSSGIVREEDISDIFTLPKSIYDDDLPQYILNTNVLQFFVGKLEYNVESKTDTKFEDRMSHIYFWKQAQQ